MHTYYFEKLDVFTNLRLIVNDIYQGTYKFPDSERYGLSGQLRRAAVSSMVNLVEGSGRVSKKDQAHFTTMAYSSMLEVLALLMISLDQTYLTQSEFDKLRSQLNLITNQLNALRKSQIGRNE